MASLAFEHGDLEAARTAAARAITIEPRSAEARHYLAAALAELGDYEGADRQYHEALSLAPDDPEILLGACHLLLDHAGEDDAFEEVLEIARRGFAIADKEDDLELKVEFLIAEGQAHMGLGMATQALPIFEKAAGVMPEHPEPWLQAGLALFDLVRLDAAREALLRALALDHSLAVAHWCLGLIAERKNDSDEASRRFKRATKEDPASFPSPITLGEDEFDRVVELALSRIPEKVRDEMANVAVTCEPLPRDDDLLSEDPPLPPTILGLFRGNPLGDKESPDPWAHFPSSIVLYQRNLERASRTKEELVEQIEITLLHEIGHYMGWDERDLALRGLD